MTAVVDTLADLLVAGLNAKLASGDWEETEYLSPFDVSAVDLPDFESVDPSATTVIQVAGYPNVDFAGIDRQRIRADVKLGICIVRKLDYDAAGKREQSLFRLLKGFTESVYQWVWRAAEGYEGKVVSVGFPAWYDLEKAKQGTFLTTVNPVYRLEFTIPAVP